MTSTPRPGRPVRGSTTGRPIMAALDLLGRRWALGVIWSLRDGARTFGQLQADLEGISTSVLSDRLRELRDADVLTTDDASRYVLTREGVQLCEALDPLRAWSIRWSKRVGGPPTNQR